MKLLLMNFQIVKTNSDYSHFYLKTKTIAVKIAFIIVKQDFF